MKLIIVSVRDVKANFYGAPGYAPTVAVAVRSFAEDVNGRDQMQSKHPADFELYELGTFDNETGEFLSHPPVVVVTGLSVLERKES